MSLHGTSFHSMTAGIVPIRIVSIARMQNPLPYAMVIQVFTSTALRRHAFWSRGIAHWLAMASNGKIAVCCLDRFSLHTYLFAGTTEYHKRILVMLSLLLQVDTLQQKCTATHAQAAQLQQQLTELQGDKALLGARLHDGSLDAVKGQLIQQLQQQLADSSNAAEGAAGQSQQAALQIQSLQDQLSLQQQAQASERERLSMEAAQSRLLCKARARQVSSLELQCKAEVSCYA